MDKAKNVVTALNNLSAINLHCLGDGSEWEKLGMDYFVDDVAPVLYLNQRNRMTVVQIGNIRKDVTIQSEGQCVETMSKHNNVLLQLKKQMLF